MVSYRTAKTKNFASESDFEIIENMNNIEELKALMSEQIEIAKQDQDKLYRILKQENMPYNNNFDASAAWDKAIEKPSFR